ncbi:MAG: dTDP-glucose 4,6-dehydratase [Candidatus Spechtbacterales bacterium]
MNNEFELVPLESDEQLKPNFAGKNIKSRPKMELASRLFSEGQVDLEGAAKITGEHPVNLKHIFAEEGVLPYKKILVCGGAGFMGSNFIHYLLKKYPSYNIANYDKLTYAGNLENLRDVENDPRYKFVKADIVDAETLENVIKDENIELVVNFAAETHVDRSIAYSSDFVRSNVLGVQTLLEAVTKNNIRLVQISTDEVYGSIDEGAFTEEHPHKPNSPYSAAKSGGDMLCRAYNETHGTDVIVTHSCNVFGPFQYPEKLIPLFITHLMEGKKVPVYGNGLNVREWIDVHDHSRAVDFIMKNGKAGDVFNIGTGQEKTNLEITNAVLENFEKDASHIEFVEDRKGHDLRYAIDSTKIRTMGWEPALNFEASIARTIDWYRQNAEWWKPLKYPAEQKNNGTPSRKGMKALITAGGRGTRLQPITFTRNKHVIPLANKPMIEHAIEKVAAAGIWDIGISINEGEKELQKILGDGERFGTKITYIEQKGGPLGLAHVIKNAKDFLGDSPFIFYLGDNIISADLNGFIDEFLSKKLSCFLALSKVKDPQRFGVPVIDGDKIIRVEEKPEKPASDFAVTGLYIYDKNVMEAVENIKPSARGELEISDTHNYLINKGLNIGWKEITGWWKDTGKPKDLLDGNRLLLEQIHEDIQGNIDKEADVSGKVILGEGSEIKGKSFVRGPVAIGKNTKIIDSYIGPYTAIGNNTTIQKAEVEHSIIMDNVNIHTPKRIVDSILGHGVRVAHSVKTSPSGHKIVVGDNSEIEL